MRTLNHARTLGMLFVLLAGFAIPASMPLFSLEGAHATHPTPTPTPTPSPTSTPTPKIIYVDTAVGSSGNGLSWLNAKKTIGEAINIAWTNDQIWVAQGTYQELVTLAANVSIYGGFDATETQLSQRDWSVNITTIDGDSGGSTITGANGALLDGFTVTGGSATEGGGILCQGTAPEIRNCIVTGNTASQKGGGVYTNSSTTLTNCVISENSAPSGAGVYSNIASPSLSKCIISKNTGVGMHFYKGAGSLLNCVIVGNTANPLYIEYPNAEPTFTNCTITGHTVTAPVIPCDGNPTFTNCILWNGGDEVETGNEDPVLNYCCVQGGWTGLGGNNVSGDPKFFHPWDGSTHDLHLRYGSPCIDSGDNSSAPGTDLEGNSRPANSTVDMGAYECTPSLIYVDEDATSEDPDGTSWTDAFPLFTEGLSASVPGDEIWVAEGTYLGPIALTRAVNLYGGFDPDNEIETMEERNPETYETIISGGGSGAVVTAQSDLTLDGFTITGGDSSHSDGGGGLYAASLSNLTINRCVVKDNSADKNGGGLLFNECSSIVVSNCQILNNVATENDGGGIMSFETNMTITGCTIQGNSAPTLMGGGIAHEQSDAGNYKLTLSSSKILDNQSNSGGGGLVFGRGTSDPADNWVDVDACEFRGNRTTGTNTFGGAVCAKFFSHIYTSSFVNCIITNNFADFGGSAMWLGESDELQLINCTIARNETNNSQGDPGVVFADDASISISNCILWNSSAADQVKGVDTADPDVGYSCVLGGWSGSGSNNISADPRFFDPLRYDYRLHSLSPCIDAGDPNTINTVDFVGHSRPLNSDFDIGAYEGSDMPALVTDANLDFEDFDVSGVATGWNVIETPGSACLTATYAISNATIGSNGSLHQKISCISQDDVWQGLYQDITVYNHVPVSFSVHVAWTGEFGSGDHPEDIAVKIGISHTTDINEAIFSDEFQPSGTTEMDIWHVLRCSTESGELNCIRVYVLARNTAKPDCSGGNNWCANSILIDDALITWLVPDALPERRSHILQLQNKGIGDQRAKCLDPIGRSAVYTANYQWYEEDDINTPVSGPGLFATAIDYFGNLYSNGEIVEEIANIDSHLSANTNESPVFTVVSGGTKKAAVYLNKVSERFDWVISGKVKHMAPEEEDYIYDNQSDAYWTRIHNGEVLAALTKSITGQSFPNLSDGSLLVKGEFVTGYEVGFVDDRVDVPVLVDPDDSNSPIVKFFTYGLQIPHHFSFIPGTDGAALVSTAGGLVRLIDSDGRVFPTNVDGMPDWLKDSFSDPEPRSIHGRTNLSRGGALGIAFHPKFSESQQGNRRRMIYIYGRDNDKITYSYEPYYPHDPKYNPSNPQNPMKIYRVELQNPATLDPSTLFDFLTESGPGLTELSVPGLNSFGDYGIGHQGGWMETYTSGGRDYLLLSTGDHYNEVSPGLSLANPQDARVLQGKLLRYEIDSNSNLLSSANGNPLIGAAACSGITPKPEVIAAGLRNPFFFTLRGSPPIDVWISTVGGSHFEEINRVPLSFTSSVIRNFGHPRVEGDTGSSLNSGGPTRQAVQGPFLGGGCFGAGYDFYSGEIVSSYDPCAPPVLQTELVAAETVHTCGAPSWYSVVATGPVAGYFWCVHEDTQNPPPPEEWTELISTPTQDKPYISTEDILNHPDVSGMDLDNAWIMCGAWTHGGEGCEAVNDLSNSVRLNINGSGSSDPVITVQPQNTTRFEGETGYLFNISADYASGFQWEVLNGTTWDTITNGDNPVLAVTDLNGGGPLGSSHSGSYRCQVSGGCGTTNSETSNTVTLTINDPESCNETNGGDLWDVPSCPVVTDSNLTPPSLYYQHFGSGGSAIGSTFLAGGHFPDQYTGDFFFVDHVHRTLTQVDSEVFDDGTGTSGSGLVQTNGEPYRISSEDFNSNEPYLRWRPLATNPSILHQGPHDGKLYYMTVGAGSIPSALRRIQYRPPQQNPTTSYPEIITAIADVAENQSLCDYSSQSYSISLDANGTHALYVAPDELTYDWTVLLIDPQTGIPCEMYTGTGQSSTVNVGMDRGTFEVQLTVSVDYNPGTGTVTAQDEAVPFRLFIGSNPTDCSERLPSSRRYNIFHTPDRTSKGAPAAALVRNDEPTVKVNPSQDFLDSADPGFWPQTEKVTNFPQDYTGVELDIDDPTTEGSYELGQNFQCDLVQYNANEFTWRTHEDLLVSVYDPNRARCMQDNLNPIGVLQHSAPGWGCPGDPDPEFTPDCDPDTPGCRDDFPSEWQITWVVEHIHVADNKSHAHPIPTVDYFGFVVYFVTPEPETNNDYIRMTVTYTNQNTLISDREVIHLYQENGIPDSQNNYCPDDCDCDECP